MSTVMTKRETSRRAAQVAAAALGWPLAWARQLSQRQPLWRNGRYLTLWGGKIVSATGSQMSQVAFPLLVLALTHSAISAGIAGALRMLPYLLFSLPAGALADRWDRRRVMLVCDLGRAVALGSIPLALAFGRLTTTQIFVVALIEGTLFVFFDVAELAALPSVVGPDQMAAASAQYISLTDGVTMLLGPALGGVLFVASQAAPFLFDTVSYLASVAALWRVRLPHTQNTALAATPESTTKGAAPTWRALSDEIMTGVVWLWRTPTLRALTLFLGASNILVAGEALIIIDLAGRRGVSAAGIGVSLAIGGAGTIVGSLFAERIAERFPFHRLFLALNWVVAPLWLLYAFVPAQLLGVVMFLMGAVFAVINVSQFTHRMSLIPAHLQGRVSSIIRLVVYGGLPMGMALTGLLIQQYGPQLTIVLLGAGMLALMTVGTLIPHLRTAATPAAESAIIPTDTPATPTTMPATKPVAALVA